MSDGAIKVHEGIRHHWFEWRCYRIFINMSSMLYSRGHTWDVWFDDVIVTGGETYQDMTVDQLLGYAMRDALDYELRKLKIEAGRIEDERKTNLY